MFHDTLINTIHTQTLACEVKSITTQIQNHYDDYDNNDKINNEIAKNHIYRCRITKQAWGNTQIYKYI